MYEALTAFIPFMETGSYGDWPERVEDGTKENPLVMCFVVYDEHIYELNRVLFKFEREHKELDLFHYPDILENNEIIRGCDSLLTVDVSGLDGKTILAMMRYVFSMERFTDGLVLEFCRSGSFLRWLQRLKTIDDNSKQTQ